MALNYYCIDAGSQYCPCHLAKTENCLICSMMQGKEICDCRWQGICVYQEYMWADGKIEERKTIPASVVEKNFLTDKLVIIKIFIPLDSLVRELNQPGTFVFLRSEGSPEYYDVPLCVMDIDESNKILSFAVNIVGPKTKAIIMSDSMVLMRGPYWNGLLGLKHIKSSYSKHWLIIGRGIGQASIISVVKNLLRGNNNITVLLDSGTLKINIAEGELKKIGVIPQEFELNNAFYKKRLREIIEKNAVDFVYSSGSDIQHMFIQNILNKLSRRIPLIASNNHQLCCGEGICGSCETLIDGELIHFCKVQLGSENVLGG